MFDYIFPAKVLKYKKNVQIITIQKQPIYIFYTLINLFSYVQ